MKKKIKDLTTKEIYKLCRKHKYSNDFRCKGCVLDRKEICLCDHDDWDSCLNDEVEVDEINNNQY